MHKNVHSTLRLFTVASNWKSSKGPSTSEWKYNFWSTNLVKTTSNKKKTHQLVPASNTDGFKKKNILGHLGGSIG